MADIRVANAPCSWGSLEFEVLCGEGIRSWIVVEQDVLSGMGSPKASAQRNRDYLRTIGL